MTIELPLALSVVLALGALRFTADIALSETGRGAGVTYHGTVTALVLPDGSIVDVPPAALGTDATGLVTAPTRAALAAGRHLAGDGPWFRISGVHYTRWRPEYHTSLWDHDVSHTEACVTDSGPVFRHVGGGTIARVCDGAGAFICDG